MLCMCRLWNYMNTWFSRKCLTITQIINLYSKNNFRNLSDRSNDLIIVQTNDITNWLMRWSFNSGTNKKTCGWRILELWVVWFGYYIHTSNFLVFLNANRCNEEYSSLHFLKEFFHACANSYVRLCLTRDFIVRA